MLCSPQHDNLTNLSHMPMPLVCTKQEPPVHWRAAAPPERRTVHALCGAVWHIHMRCRLPACQAVLSTHKHDAKRTPRLLSRAHVRRERRVRPTNTTVLRLRAGGSPPLDAARGPCRTRPMPHAAHAAHESSARCRWPPMAAPWRVAPMRRPSAQHSTSVVPPRRPPRASRICVACGAAAGVPSSGRTSRERPRRSRAVPAPRHPRAVPHGLTPSWAWRGPRPPGWPTSAHT